MGRENHEWIDGKTSEELEMIEHAGRLHFPDKIRRMKKGGGFDDVPVLVRVPRTVEIAYARKDAIALAKTIGIDREADADIFDQLDTMAVLARAIRDPAPPHDQFQPLDFLLSHEPGKGFDTESLMDVWTRLEAYRRLIDPRITEVTEDDAIRAAFAIDRVKNISPLAVIAGRELDSCIVTMACLLASCLRERHSARSGETGAQVA